VGTAQWKLNYVSVNGAHVTTDSQGNDVLLTVDHGETKTYEAAYDKAGDRYYYQGPFTPSASFLAGGAPYNESPPDLTCGYNGYTGAGGGGLGSGFKTCYKGYSGFVFTATNTFSAANDYGMSLADDSGGPVMWPTPGYYDLATPKQLATGFRGGSSILANGYLYIFVLDDNLGDPLSGTIAGQTVSLANKGEKVARALIGADGKPGPFMSYNVFTDAFDAPSLPAGFDKTRIADFIDVPGPQVPALFSLEALNDTGYPLETNRFSVAFDPARNLYIGIEHYSSGNGGQSMAFRESCDLVHWSPRSVLMSGGAPLDASSFNYPAFVDSAFTTNYVVDSSNLYILGTNSDPDLKTSATYYLQASLR
jgi:hypothetical protein